MQQTSISPKERINIRYQSNINQLQEDIELPLKLMVLGKFSTKQQRLLTANSSPRSIDKDNFDQIMKSQNLNINLEVDNHLHTQAKKVAFELKPQSIKDLSPDGIIQQVPELKKLLLLRQALISLKGPLGNLPAFCKQLETMLQDPKQRQKLQQELSQEQKYQ